MNVNNYVFLWWALCFCHRYFRLNQLCFPIISIASNWVFIVRHLHLVVFGLASHFHFILCNIWLWLQYLVLFAWFVFFCSSSFWCLWRQFSILQSRFVFFWNWKMQLFAEQSSVCDVCVWCDIKCVVSVGFCVTHHPHRHRLRLSVWWLKFYVVSLPCCLSHQQS